MGSYICCSTTSQENRSISSLASLLAIVAEPTRLKLLCILRKGEHCVCELIEHLDVSQSLISHHLKDLKDNELVRSERRGQKVYYLLTPSGHHITQTLFHIVEKGEIS